MSRQVKMVCALVLAGLLAAGSVQAEDNTRKVVRTRDGTIVRAALFGGCVRTQWDEGVDVCGDLTGPVKERTVLSKDEATIYFAFNSSKLSEEAKGKLRNIARRLRGAEDVHSAQIVGYADRIGSVPYNEKLSLKRANAVKSFLAENGYLNSRVAAVRGLGETNPTTTCPPGKARKTEITCLAPDRRVEVEIDYLDIKRVLAAQ